MVGLFNTIVWIDEINSLVYVKHTLNVIDSVDKWNLKRLAFFRFGEENEISVEDFFSRKCGGISNFNPFIFFQSIVGMLLFVT